MITPTSWLHPLCEAGSCHAYYTSRGDVADIGSPYSGFSVCHYTGDSDAGVAACRKKLSEIIGIGEERIVIPCQTHSSKVVTIDSVPVSDALVHGCDGLVTAMKNVVIGVNTADCVPVALLDPVGGIVGVAHAGWRGAIDGIVEATVDAMVAKGSSAGNICYALGPSICQRCFEVGEEVAARFPDSMVSRLYGVRPHVDLQGYVVSVLHSMGVTPSHGFCRNDEMCTRHHPDRFFSARALGTASGRGFTFVFIN